MIDIMLRGIVSNTVNINHLANHVKKSEAQLGLSLLCIAGYVYISGKVIIKQGERIKALESTINEIKSKGE